MPKVMTITVSTTLTVRKLTHLTQPKRSEFGWNGGITNNGTPRRNCIADALPRPAPALKGFRFESRDLNLPPLPHPPI